MAIVDDSGMGTGIVATPRSAVEGGIVHLGETVALALISSQAIFTYGEVDGVHVVLTGPGVCASKLSKRATARCCPCTWPSFSTVWMASSDSHF